MSRIKVATLNLLGRMGEWERRAPLVIEQLHALSPDVIGLQEVDLMLDQGMWISREVNKTLGEESHYRAKHAASPGVLASIHGIGTLARIECTEHEVLDLMSFERVAQRLVYRAGDTPFVFVNTHLHHPPEAAAERVREAQYLLEWLDRREPRLPTVIAGDFNSYVHEEVVKLMKSRLRSAYEAVHGREPEKTWTTPVNKWDNSPHGTLDYIYVSPEFRIAEAGLAFDTPSADDPDLYPSDHLGVYAVLDL
jgi:endonuclease/exonuclease/phosphatase family metal-dependent hydrolase